MSTMIKHSMYMTGRSLRFLSRQPFFLAFTLIQPLIWLLLFGSLFERIVELPGFGTTSYITHLTPGVVIMTALFSAGWGGAGFIQDMDRGVMDRHLTSPIKKGAIIMGVVLYQVVITLIQSLIVFGVGWALGARFEGGVAGVAIMLLAAGLIAVIFSALSHAFALLLRVHEALIGISQFLNFPLLFLSSAMIAPELMPAWVGTVARYNPLEWAIMASRTALGADADWGVIWLRIYLLAMVGSVLCWLATRAFRAYQRAA